MPLSDYRHHNEDAERVWWEEEGRHGSEPPDYDPDDYLPGPDDEDDWCDPCDRSADECICPKPCDSCGAPVEEAAFDPRDQPDYHLDMYMEDQLSGGGMDVDF